MQKGAAMNNYIRTVRRSAIILVLIAIVFNSCCALAENCDYLNVAQRCKNYLVDNKYHYYKGIYPFPISVDNGRYIDCSSYVSWTIYEYQHGNFEGFTSKWFLDTAKKLYKGDYDSLPEYTDGWTAIKDSEYYEPGDILVYSGHVQIYYRKSSDDSYEVLNAGSNDSLKLCVTKISKGYFNKAQYAIRLPC